MDHRNKARSKGCWTEMQMLPQEISGLDSKERKIILSGNILGTNWNQPRMKIGRPVNQIMQVDQKIAVKFIKPIPDKSGGGTIKNVLDTTSMPCAKQNWFKSCTFLIIIIIIISIKENPLTL